MKWGNIEIPWTVSWTGEETQFVGRCKYAGGMLALRMIEAPGVGKPQFKTPHSDRQRKCIVEGRCDLCGKHLRLSTKVSLSHARVRSNGAEGPCVMQVEPLVHKPCALVCIEQCPALKRDIAAGILQVRQVLRSRVQIAIMGLEYIQHYVPGYQPQRDEKIAGHAKVELLRWIDRDEAWLRQTAEAA
ncbi:hypothetical protein SAMN05216337_1017105 [Bradyrhizobium brasilense]|uniref:Uncharacterized protein n=1 Tax=Bradyrhizobium brasilense TaxID=1419277 RepID=A0A1G6YV27_9BRAD|nr:hypothetical protein [Bradyrhizobium brasilense]SDD94190.1 hypothetical protein SAMN05216337_1017105 [Bradyrhizobium brasilense]